MNSRRVAAVVGVAEIEAAWGGVLGDPGRSIADEAAGYELDTLCDAVVLLLQEITQVVRGLPPAAFQRQPDDVDGSDVWSAGEIAAHLAEMEIASLPFWERVCSADLPDPPAELVASFDRPPGSQPACLELLAALSAHNQRVVDMVRGRCNGDEQSMHFVLGQTDVRTALFGASAHLLDHLQQLRALGYVAEVS